MSQLFYCSYCGGLLESDKINQCPHCGVSLRGVHEGSLEGRSHIQQAYAKHKAEERAEENRWKRHVFWKKVLKPILIRFVLPLCLFAGLFGLLYFTGSILNRLFQPLFTGTNNTNLRTLIAAIAVLATPLTSLAIFSIIPIRNELDVFYWWNLFKPELLDTKTWKEKLHDPRSRLEQAVEGLVEMEMFDWNDPRKEWFPDPELSDRYGFHLGPDWPTSRSIKYFVIIQTAIWLIGITGFVIVMGLDNLVYLATVLPSNLSPLSKGILTAIGAFILFLVLYKPIRNTWKNRALNIKKDKKGNYLCPKCHCPFESNEDVYDHLKRYHLR